METYKSEKQTIECDIDTVFSKLSNPAVFKEQIDANIDKIPEEARKNLDSVKFEADGVSIESPMGQLKMAVIEKISNGDVAKVVFGATQSPVAFNLVIELNKLSEEQTQSLAMLQLDIPLMLRAMVGGKLKDGAKMFGEMIAKIPYKSL